MKKNTFRWAMYGHLKKELGDGRTVWAINQSDIFYKGITDDLLSLQKNRGFKFHRFVIRPHVVSSQAACFNLFLPIMKSHHAVEILKAVRPDLAKIDDTHIREGFTFEYWGDIIQDVGSKGLLNDHSPVAGTDADFALSYIDTEGNHCLWLVEHKLTEMEFTQCNVVHGGKHIDCIEKCKEESVQALLDAPEKCYYCGTLKYRYWELTKRYIDAFPNIDYHAIGCPFADGMCQLWRNVLLAKAAQEAYGYDKVYFSMVKPKDNICLDDSIAAFNAIVDKNMFSVFCPESLVDEASRFADDFTRDWVKWYRKTYIEYEPL